MSMPRITYEDFNNRITEAKKLRNTTWGGATKETVNLNLSSEEQRKIYHELIQVVVKDDPVLKKAFDALASSDIAINHNDLLFSALPQRYNRAAFKKESMYSKEVMTELFAWLDFGADEKLKQTKKQSARGRFILCLDRACEAILKEKDSDARIGAWLKLSEILEAIFFSQIAGTRGYREWLQSGLGIAFWLTKDGKKKDSKNHFRNRIFFANYWIEKCIQQERIAQAQTNIQTVLSELNTVMESAVNDTAARLISNLLLDKKYTGVLTDCHTIHSNNIDINNLVWLGLQEALSFFTIKKSEYAFVVDNQSVQTESGKMVANFNANLALLKGTHFIQILDNEDGGFETKLEHSKKDNFNHFVSQLENGNFDEKGNLCLKVRDNNGELVTHLIPTGFNAFVNSNPVLLKQKNQAYLEIVKAIKKVINCLERNHYYYRFIMEVGDKSAAVILLKSDFCEQLEDESLSLMEGLSDKLKAFHKSATTVCIGDADYENISIPQHSISVENLGAASLQIKTFSQAVEEVQRKTSKIREKRLEIQSQAKKCTTCQEATKNLLEQQAEYVRKQRALGVEVKILTQAEQNFIIAAAIVEDAKTIYSANLTSKQAEQISSTIPTTSNYDLKQQNTQSSNSSSSAMMVDVLMPQTSSLQAFRDLKSISPTSSAASVSSPKQTQRLQLSERPMPLSLSTSSSTATFASSSAVMVDVLMPQTSPPQASSDLKSVSSTLSVGSISSPEQTQRLQRLERPMPLSFAQANNAALKLLLHNIKIELGYKEDNSLNSELENVFKRYALPQWEESKNSANADNQVIANFLAEMAYQENVASILKSNITSLWYYCNPLEWWRNYKGNSSVINDRNNNTAARLAICKYMQSLLSRTLNEEKGSFTADQIDTMYMRVQDFLKKQPQRMGASSFNASLINIGTQLTEDRVKTKNRFAVLESMRLTLDNFDNENLNSSFEEKASSLKSLITKLNNFNDRCLYVHIEEYKSNIRNRLDMLLIAEHAQIKTEIEKATATEAGLQIHKKRITLAEHKGDDPQKKFADTLLMRLAKFREIIDNLKEVTGNEFTQKHITLHGENHVFIKPLFEKIHARMEQTKIAITNIELVKTLKKAVFNQLSALLPHVKDAMNDMEFSCLNKIDYAMDQFLIGKIDFITLKTELLELLKLANRNFSPSTTTILADVSNQLNLSLFSLENLEQKTSISSIEEKKADQLSLNSKSKLDFLPLNEDQLEQIECIVEIAKSYIHQKLDEYIEPKFLNTALFQLQKSANASYELCSNDRIEELAGACIKNLPNFNNCPSHDRRKILKLFVLILRAEQCMSNVSGAPLALRESIIQCIDDLTGEECSKYYGGVREHYGAVLKAIAKLAYEAYGFKHITKQHQKIIINIDKNAKLLTFQAPSVRCAAIASELEKEALEKVRGVNTPDPAPAPARGYHSTLRARC